MNVYEYFNNKKVYIKDVYGKLLPKVTLYYKNQKVGVYKKEQLNTIAWASDRVSYLSVFPEEGKCAVYLIPDNKYLTRSIVLDL